MCLCLLFYYWLIDISELNFTQLRVLLFKSIIASLLLWQQLNNYLLLYLNKCTHRLRLDTSGPSRHSLKLFKQRRHCIIETKFLQFSYCKWMEPASSSSMFCLWMLSKIDDVNTCKIWSSVAKRSQSSLFLSISTSSRINIKLRRSKMCRDFLKC